MKLEDLEKKILQSEAYLNISVQDPLLPKTDRIYQNLQESHYSSTPRGEPRMYPALPVQGDVEKFSRFLEPDPLSKPSAPDVSKPTPKPRN